MDELATGYAGTTDGGGESMSPLTGKAAAATGASRGIGRSTAERLCRETVARMGGLDILVANARYACFKPFAEITEEDFDRTYALNAKGTYFCLKEALRHVTDGGRIVCVSTMAPS
jgi:3-oxoacyl-[acyl-carrier protein] reductase